MGPSSLRPGVSAEDDFNHVHTAGPDGLSVYTLDTTDIARVHALSVGPDDALFIRGALREPWGDAGIRWGLARLTLGASPSTELLMTWGEEAFYDEVSSIVFGPEDRVVMLLRGPSGTAIEQRTLP